MCGLIGVYSKNNNPVSESTLFRGIKSLHHRGPDSNRIWLSSTRNIGLGHTRLSIIGLDNGEQPLTSKDGNICAVVNGEFYDYETIRNTYRKRGYTFSTDSDSEIIIPLYLERGMDGLKYLRGEFAFILWDQRIQTMFICRDRLGIKPLVYAQMGECIYVASEAKALFEMGVKAHWDNNTIVDSEYLVRDIENTYFEHVKNVKPGFYIKFTPRDTQHHQYWDLNYPYISQAENGLTENDYINQFREILEESIRLRLKADVAVGCYLSGGIDSAAILGLAAKLTNATAKAYTISFNDEAYNEFSYAAETASLVGADHSVVSIDEGDLATNLSEALWYNETPMTNGNGVAKFLLSKHVQSAGHKVVLTGEGADEILAGYSFFREDALTQESCTNTSSDIQQRLRQLHAANHLTSGVFNGEDPSANMSTVNAALGYTPTLLKAFTQMANIMQALRSSNFAVSETLAGKNTGAFSRFLNSLNINQIVNRDVVNKSLYIHCKSILPNYILTILGDRSEMAHSIEGRVPFLDHRLVEFSAQVPAALKINGLTEKYLLRESVRDVIPESIYKRQKHPFMAPPAKPKSSSPLNTLMADIFHGRELSNLPFYSQKKVIKLFEDTRKKNEKSVMVDTVLMTILSLCLLQKKFNL